MRLIAFRTDDAEDFVLVDVQRDAFQRRLVAVANT
jgi:hypothetical protein